MPQKLTAGPFPNGATQELDLTLGTAPVVGAAPHTFGKPGGPQVTVVLGAVTPPSPPPPPPPPPPADGPALPASIPVTPGAVIFDSIDPTSAAYDTGADGLQVFGSMNGVTCNPGNAKLVNGVLNLTLDSSGHGTTITTLPRNDPTSGRPRTGAATGLAFTAAIVEVDAVWSSADGRTADSWDGGWSVGVIQVPQTPYQAMGGEIDFVEMGRWPGGAGNATASYHYAPGNQTNPNAIDLGAVFDGKRHKYTLVRTAGNCWICRDGQVKAGPFPCKDGLTPHFLILTKGAGNASTSQVFRVRAWEIA